MSQSDPPIIVTGGSAKVKLGIKYFPGVSKKDFDDPNVSIRYVVVKDKAGNELKTFDFPDGKFSVEFHTDDTP